jgi:hypothetical protein
MDSLIKKSKNIFIREVESYKIYINNKSGKIKYLERYYNFPEIKLPYSDKIYNNKIGSLDIESFIIYKDSESDSISVSDTDKDIMKKKGSKLGFKENLCGNYYNIDEKEEEGLGKLSVYAGG